MPNRNDALFSSAEPGRRWRPVVRFLLTFGFVCLCFALVAPFLPAIVWAVALAVSTRTPYKWLRRQIRRPNLCASTGVFFAVVLIMVPAFVLGRELVARVLGVASLVQSGAAEDWVSATIDNYPRIAGLVGQASNVISFRQAAQAAGGYVATWLQGLLAGSVAILYQVVLMLFILFFLFRDQELAVRLLRSLLPLSGSESDRLLKRMSDTISATIQGSLTIAVIQGCLGGVMFAILSVPDALFWGSVMAMLATVPSLGTFLVWMPVALFLLLSGHWVKAAILGAWGALVIGTIDNLLYPGLVGSRLQLHTVPMLLAVLGGIGLFGINGIILGPLILTTSIALLQLWAPAGFGPNTDPAPSGSDSGS